MTTEELMKPRYKVIADFPGSPFKISEVWNKEAIICDPALYPHLFQKLEWWQERKPEDMPEYVRWNNEKIPEHGSVEKVMHAELTWTMGIKVDSQVNHVKAEYFLPATAAEYEAYQATLKQQ